MAGVATPSSFCLRHMLCWLRGSWRLYLLLLLLTSIMTGPLTPSLPATCKQYLQEAAELQCLRTDLCHKAM